MTRKKCGFIESLKTDLPLEKVDVDVECFAKPLTVGQMRRLYKAAETARGEVDEEELTVKMVAASIVDSDGNRLIPEGEESGILDLPQATFMALQNAAMKVNGLGGTEGN